MKFKKFIELCDNWNSVTRVKDNKSNSIIIEEQTHVIMDTRKDLFDKKVVAFGFYDGVMVIRIK